jgi:hypothetical protein
MTPQQLQERLHQSAWSKDVIAWFGRRITLDGLLHDLPQVALDILDLLPEDDALPAAFDGRNELLGACLETRVCQLRPTDGGRAVLRVRNAALLQRYRVSLGAFFDWFAGSHTLTVLEIDRPCVTTLLPATVADSLRLNPNTLVSYFRSCLQRPDNLCIES